MCLRECTKLSEIQNDVFVDLRSKYLCHVGAPAWHLHTKLYKIAWNLSENNLKNGTLARP